MRRILSCFLILIFILFIYITISLSSSLNVREYLEGRFPAIYAIYLASLGELDIYEMQFIDLLEELPELEQRIYIREVYEKGFSLDLLDKLKRWQKKTEKPYLNVAYPSQTEITIWKSPLFVFGTTDSSPDIKVTVNGKEVQLHDYRTGNFLTLVDILEGEKTPIVITASRDDEQVSIERMVYYPKIWEAMPISPLTIHSTRTQPQRDQVLTVGDKLRVMFQGSPEAEAIFRIGENLNEVLMEELNNPDLPLEGRGIYKGSYIIKEQDAHLMNGMGTQAITVTLRRGNEQISKKLPGRVSFSSQLPIKIIEVVRKQAGIHRIIEDSFVFQGSTLGGDGVPTQVFEYYLLPGTLFGVTGIAGDYLRLKLGTNNYLIHKDDVREVKNFSQNPDGGIHKIEITESRDNVTVLLNTKKGIPFLMENEKNGLRLILYGINDSKHVSYEGLASSVQKIKVEPIPEEGSNVVAVTIELYQPMTGFDYRWRQTGLEISIRKSPEIDRINSIQGRTIVIDPGHGGTDSGAIGPGNVHEKDVVLEIGKYLQNILEKEGARVLMTRTNDVNVNLSERIDLAIRNNADLFISIHANAHAIGADAVNYHGHMTIYNYNFNQLLAETIMDNLIKGIGLPKARIWQRSDLTVLRYPQVPSVMVETAFMMHPDDNWYLLQPIYQREFADSIKEGIEYYFNNFLDSNK